MKIFDNSELSDCDLIIDAIYEGGNNGNSGDDPITKILPVGNQGGFRFAGKIDNLKYIVLYTSGENMDWPDTIDLETGVFQYYGDNKKPGHELHDTRRKGNLILKNLFDSLNSIEDPRIKIPPIFIFKKFPTQNSNRSVQFKGLCVPGTLQRNQIDNLVAVWKTSNGFRFQNYAAFFTILDIARISRNWLNKLNEGDEINSLTPLFYKRWKIKGVYTPLLSKKTLSIRSISQQLPTNTKENDLLNAVYQYFIKEPTLFEFFAAEIYRMTSSNIIIDEVTQNSVDGGRDALGRLKMGLLEDPIYVDFALEAKCYNPGINGVKINTVGVKEVSRLISRIRNRQYGILITTSAIAKQAYDEVRKDGHPIIFMGGKDIIHILIEKGINSVVALKTYLEDNFPLKGI